jgi:hypothetical protein
MRISPPEFRSRWLRALRFAGPCLLIAFLLLSVSVFARTTQAALHRERRSRQLHISHRAHRHRSVNIRSSRTARRRQFARLHRHGHRSRARRQRSEAALDNIRTHMPLTDTTAPNGEETASITNQLDTARPPALIAPIAETNPNTANAANRDVPFFQASVPSYMPVALRGSHEVLVHQNIIADVEGLSRIQNDEQLSAMVHSGDLVALPASSMLVIDSRLPMNRRYCRRWVANFLSDLSRAHESIFGHPLNLTSAVRTVEFQRHLAHYNGNAAPAYGDTASPHLTGQAIDLGKKGMSLREIAWMRTVLGQLQAAGKLDVEEEFEQACFHISVYKTYSPHVTLPATLVASEDAIPEVVQPQNTVIGGLAHPALRTVSEPVERRSWTRSHHSYARAGVRRAAVLRRRRHHRAAMAMLAARMR